MLEKQEINKQLSDFLESLEFTKLFDTFRIAINPAKLFLALMAVLILGFSGMLMDNLVCKVNVINYSEAEKFYPELVTIFNQNNFISEIDVYLEKPSALNEFKYEDCKNQIPVFTAICKKMSKCINNIAIDSLTLNIAGIVTEMGIISKTIFWSLKFYPIFSIPYGLLVLCITAYFGGAICRSAAVEHCTGRKIGPGAAIRYTNERIWDFLCAPLAPIVLMLFLGLIIFVSGLIGNLPWVGNVLFGFCAIFGLIIGFVITLIMIGYAGGLHMMAPSIAIEGTDFNDAVNRSYCYTYTKPWYLLLYSFMSIVYGALSYLFIRLCAYLLLRTTYAFFEIASLTTHGDNASKLSTLWARPEFFNLLGNSAYGFNSISEKTTYFLISAAVLLVSCMLASFVVSFYYTSSTIIYTLMRKKTDKDPLTKIFLFTEVVTENQNDKA